MAELSEPIRLAPSSVGPSYAYALRATLAQAERFTRRTGAGTQNGSGAILREL
jgi:hypothetical protein